MSPAYQKEIKPSEPTAIYCSIESFKANSSPKMHLNYEAFPVFSNPAWTNGKIESTFSSSTTAIKITESNTLEQVTKLDDEEHFNAFIKPNYVREYKIKVKGYKIDRSLPKIF